MSPWIALPWVFLSLAAATTAAVFAVDRHLSRRRALRLKRLADRHGFRYSLVDRFRLAARVAPAIPADGVTVRDLMYRRDGAGYTYAFTAVFGDRPRVVVVVRASEATDGNGGQLVDVKIADAGLPLGEQYRRFLNAEETAAGPS